MTDTVTCERCGGHCPTFHSLVLTAGGWRDYCSPACAHAAFPDAFTVEDRYIGGGDSLVEAVILAESMAQDRPESPSNMQS